MDRDKVLFVKALRGLTRPSDGDRAKPELKRKDAWDKAAIMISATSSIVLALAALLINSSLQRSQLDNATRAAAEQAKAQSFKNITDLIQYLQSEEPLKQRIALVALRGEVENDDDMIVDIVRIVALTSKDLDVRDEAIATLKRSKSERVAEILSAIYRKPSTPDGIRDSAYLASQTVALRAIAWLGHLDLIRRTSRADIVRRSKPRRWRVYALLAEGPR